MIRFWGAVLACLALWLIVSVEVYAQAPLVTLQSGASVQYRFDYRGDGSVINVGVKAPGAANIFLSVYTPTQVEALRRGEQPQPVGRGSASRDYELFWSGGFKAPATYYAVVENRGSYAVQYRLDITGSGVSSVAQVAAALPQASSSVSTIGGQSTLSVDFPPNSAALPLRLPIPPQPAACMHAKEVPAVIAQSAKLCSGETYPPLRIAGNNIALFGDDARTATVTSVGRQFAVTAEGSNIWIEGLNISSRPDPADAGAWLCLYDECLFATRPLTTTIRGGIRYGGGILLRGSNSTIRRVTVRGGTIGIATVDGRMNNILENELSDLNGWGSFNVNSIGGYFVANTMNRNNHGCTTPDGNKFLYGCETASWVCLNCTANVIISNHCELSANCFYMSGERGLASNDNKFVANYCAGATNNCFELTFSLGNLLLNNVSTVEQKSNAACSYPYWVGGSVVNFQGNRWECKISADDAFNQSRDSTVVATNIINLDAFGPVTITPSPRGVVVARTTPTPAPKDTFSPGGLRFPRGDVLEVLP